MLTKVRVDVVQDSNNVHMLQTCATALVATQTCSVAHWLLPSLTNSYFQSQKQLNNYQCLFIYLFEIKPPNSLKSIILP